jgi:ProQ C-terminal domain
MMDTRTLVVGQKVRLQSGTYCKEATVTEIDKHSVYVEPLIWSEMSQPYTLRFHISSLNWLNGKQTGIFFGDVEYDRRPLCTEFGAWELATGD